MKPYYPGWRGLAARLISTGTAAALCTFSWTAPLCLKGALEWSAAGSGGSGTWDLSQLNWRDGSAATAWQNGADAVFAGAAGTVELGESLTAGTLQWQTPGYVLHMNSLQQSLRLREWTGQPTIRFAGVVNANADAYPPFATQRDRGLILEPGRSVELSGRIEPLLGGSPFLSVRGVDSVVTFNGTWIADTGSIISWLMPIEGGTFRIGANADFRFIKEEYYTLQLWVQGDGTGTLEIEEGFAADRTQNAQTPLGIGSIRLSNSTFITHHSRNLPLGYRPKSTDSTQANGHLVFESQGGSRWIVRSNDQVYPGAVWIYRDLTLHTEANLTHTGVTESGSGYTALNGWSVFGCTIRKTGPGQLTLAGEQAYNSGSLFIVEDGTLTFATDPSDGTHFSGGTRIATLDIQVGEAATAQFLAPSRISSLEVSGRWAISQPLYLGGVNGLWLEPGSETYLTVTAAGDTPLINVDYSAYLNGKLIVSRGAAFAPPRGTRIPLVKAGAVSGQVFPEWELVDQSGLGLILDSDGIEAWLITTRHPGEAAGKVILEEEFANLDAWQDLSTVPLWGSPRRARSAFTTADNRVQLIREGPDDTRPYIGYSSTASLKTFTALDFRFPQSESRAGATLTADIRLRWESATSDSGEGGRFILAYNHAYPAGGLDLTPEGSPGSKIADFSAAWWARPAYHIRLRNGTTNAGSSFLQYGGGMSSLGEYEATDNWWLPGFISGAGGVAPGSGDDFPANSWVRTQGGLATEQFTLFRYILYPDRQELWRDDNRNGLLEEGELKAVMPLPQSSPAPLYQYIDAIEGVRLFWNGNAGSSGPDTGQVYVDSLRLTVNRDALPVAAAAIPATQIITNGISGGVELDASASFHPDGLPLRYEWSINGQWAAASLHPLTVLRLPLGAHTITLTVTDPLRNASSASFPIIVSSGNLRPIAHPGNDQTVTANSRLLASVTFDGSSSSDPDGSIVAYTWSRTGSGEILQTGSDPVLRTVLPVGLHSFTLRVTDNEGASHSASTRVQVNAASSATPVVIYLENFSRPADGTEMGPWEVGWNLTRFDGDPVASIRFDGNAHRSLSTNPTSNAPYRSKINADPTGTEYDAPNSSGYMWMNQMPFLNASPAEWMLWTDEFVVDTNHYEITAVDFLATDSSPERVKVSLAARVEGQWYIFWDGRVETRYSSWISYRISFATSGWYRFDPSPAFTIRNAVPSDLPPGDIEAFGLYLFKDYGWYVNQIDNFTIWARERVLPPQILLWQLASFDPADLLDDSLAASLWGPFADPNHNGLPNFVEFALGRDPLAATYSAPYQMNIGAQGNPELHIGLNPHRENVQLTLQHSPDLQNWQTVAEPDWQLRGHDGAGREEWTIRLPAPANAEPAFYRIQWLYLGAD